MSSEETDPAKVLADILEIIAGDVANIKTTNEQLLSPAAALALTRYASALDDIVKNTEKEKQKLKNKYQSMSTEELINEFNKEKK